MKKPVLVIMAAGMGSRYGGLKQIDPVDPEGHIIMDFSIYDAKRAGFEKVIFVIKEEMEAVFKAAVGDRISREMDVAYVYQDIRNLPDGFAAPKGRTKPWGTAHAVYSCRDVIDGPFAVINADDYYGVEAFRLIYDYLSAQENEEIIRCAMVAYLLGNTVTDNGYVSRGVCALNAAGELAGITERVRIEKKPDGIAYTEDDGKSWEYLPASTPVSMNLWGFPARILDEIADGFSRFLTEGLKENPLKCEYYLPGVVGGLLAKEKASVKVLTSEDQWYGVTYKEDKPMVTAAIRRMKDQGLYPQGLWTETKERAWYLRKENQTMAKILITGGAGYIGSHTALELLNAGYEVVVYDNLCNSSKESLRRVEELTGRGIAFYEGDVLDACALREMFRAERVDAVIHCAALKAVGESVQKPLTYYHNNLTGTLTLMREMSDAGVKKIVFSSSATVYGNPKTMPITEDCPKGACTNPYGWTKSMMEQIMTDIQKADPEWNVILLRYFNPVGAHKSGRIGEDPKGIPNNLMPYISQVAVGKREKLGVFGNDYDTPDGTGVRDYIHVVDLAIGHVKAIDYIFTEPGLDVINLGTGKGYSVLDMVRAFGKACGKEIPYEIKPRRAGDIAICYADPTKAKETLGWEAKRGLDEMCEDSWRWQSQNPNGYQA